MSRSATEVMTTADMNVRPLRPAAPSRPERAPASRLARLLLHCGRRLLLPLLVLSMPACIIPVGPEFRDPSGVPNSPPFITFAAPEIGRVVTQPTFQFTVEDHNLGDTLYVRWLIDFPPFTQGTTVIFPPDIFMNPQDSDRLQFVVTKRFECAGPAPLPSHQIMAIVADRAFEPTPQNPAAVPEGGHSVTATWTWNSTDCR
jgi:hypothetical protein